MNKIFGEKLKEYRNQLEIKRNRKVGQTQLAKELGISNGNIGNLESGKRVPSKKMLIKLTDHSRKSLSYWTDGVEEYNAPNSVDLVLDKMIETGIIKKELAKKSPLEKSDFSDEIWKIITDAALLEIERKLK